MPVDPALIIQLGAPLYVIFMRYASDEPADVTDPTVRLSVPEKDPATYIDLLSRAATDEIVSVEADPTLERESGTPERVRDRMNPSDEPADVTGVSELPVTERVPENVPATTIGPPASATEALDTPDEDERKTDQAQEPEGETFPTKTSEIPAGVREELQMTV